MNDIVLGIAASHTTLMNTQWDKVAHLASAHAFKEALASAKQTLREASIDVAIIVGSNHFRGHWLDLMPSFTIGVDEIESSGEHGTPKGSQYSCPEIALPLANALIDDGFDLAFSTRLVIDHGISHAIQYLTGENDIPVVPIMINCFAPPLPKLNRCLQLGAAIASALRNISTSKRIAIIASGGLSHKLPFPDWRKPKNDNDRFLVESWREGRGDWQRYEKRRREIIVNAPADLNEEFDEAALQAFSQGKVQQWVNQISEDELVELAGIGANEMRNWLVMHAALGFPTGKVLSYSPIREWLTGMGVFITTLKK